MIDSGHAALWPRAGVNLGHLLSRIGDSAGAEAVFRQVAESFENFNHVTSKLQRYLRALFGEAAPHVVLADVRQRRPHPAVFADAELGLAALLARRGDLDAA